MAEFGKKSYDDNHNCWHIAEDEAVKYFSILAVRGTLFFCLFSEMVYMMQWHFDSDASIKDPPISLSVDVADLNRIGAPCLQADQQVILCRRTRWHFVFFSITLFKFLSFFFLFFFFSLTFFSFS